MKEALLAAYLRDGDSVLVGQAAAEPVTLVDELLRAAAPLTEVTAMCGLTVNDRWLDAPDAGVTVSSYLAHGPLRILAERGALEVLPWHYSEMERHFRDRSLPVDVVLLQVSPPDNDGFYSFGTTVDHAAFVAQTARTVVVEINDQMPATRSALRLHRSQVTASREVSTPLATTHRPVPTDAERLVAAHVRRLVPDGATVQLGIGGLAQAIGSAISARRDLRVRSGLVGDWLLEMARAGALRSSHDAVVAGLALGSEELYELLATSEQVRFAPMSGQLRDRDPAWDAPAFSLNSAIEVDLLGQVNAEVAAGRYVGGVGGQVDFLRAARRTRVGGAVVALPSTSPRGASRIVSTLSGPVTSLKSDVDFVVTEWGVADLRSATLSERASRMIAVADPSHREALEDARPRWCRPSRGHGAAHGG